MNIKIKNNDKEIYSLNETDNFFVETTKLSNNSLERKIVILLNSLLDLESLFEKFSIITDEITVEIYEKEIKIINFVVYPENLMISTSTQNNENKLILNFILDKE